MSWLPDVQPAASAGVRLLLRTKRIALTNQAREALQASPIRIVSTALFIGLIWLGLYGLFYAVFEYFRQLPLEGAVALPLIFSFFFVALLILLTFSNAVIAYNSLFGGDESPYLLAAPIPPRAVVIVKYLETLLFSSWSLILLGLPLMMAIADFTHDRKLFYPLFLALFVFFVPIPGAAGLIVAWLTARFVPRTIRRALIGVGAVVLVAATVWGLRTIQLSDGQSSAWLKQFFVKMDFVQSALLPSNWVSLGIDRAIHNEPTEAMGYLAVTLANALFGSLVAVWIVSRGYLSAYDRASESRGRPSRSTTTVSPRLERILFCYLPRDIRLVASKDLQTFLRDPMQWSQLVILFGLMGLYLLNMPQFHIDLVSERLSLLVPFLNLSAVSFILATFTSRFVYPLVSLEGRQLWLIGLLPIGRGRILAAKFAFAMTVSVTVAVGTMGLATVILKMSWAWTLIYLVVTFAVCAGLCGLAVGIGARLPLFGERNPARIANGFGGTVNLIASVGMVVFILAGMAFVAIGNRADEVLTSIDGTTLYMCGAVVAVAVITGIVAMLIGADHLKKLEV